MLRKIGVWNDIPKELLPKLPDAGTIVTFKAALSIKDTETGEMRYQACKGIPATSTFRCPIDIDGYRKGDSIKVGLVYDVDKDGVITNRYKPVFKPQETSGLLVIEIGSSEQMDDLYLYLRLASFVGTNENRFENTEVILNLVDERADALKEREARKLIRKALEAAFDIEDADLKEKCLLVGVSPDLDPVTQRNQLEAIAEKRPQEFLDKINDTDAVLIATVKEAIQVGSLVKEGKVIKWKHANTPLFELTQDDDLLIAPEFTSFIKGEKMGAKIVEKIKSESNKLTKKK